MTSPGDLVNEETINREVIVRGGLMSGGYSTSIDVENDFILNSHILAKFRKEFENKMNFKTDSNFKESRPGEIRKQEEQIARLTGSLNNYSKLFHEVAWNMVTGVEIPGNIINGLLLSRKYATERVEQFTKKRLLSPEVNFYDPMQGITIATLLKKKQRKLISVLKEAFNFHEAHEAFNFPLINIPITVFTPEGESYQPKTKYLFRNYLIKLPKHQSQWNKFKFRCHLRCNGYYALIFIWQNLGALVSNFS